MAPPPFRIQFPYDRTYTGDHCCARLSPVDPFLSQSMLIRFECVFDEPSLQAAIANRALEGWLRGRILRATVPIYTLDALSSRRETSQTAQNTLAELNHLHDEFEHAILEPQDLKYRTWDDLKKAPTPPIHWNNYRPKDLLNNQSPVIQRQNLASLPRHPPIGHGRPSTRDAKSTKCSLASRGKQKVAKPDFDAVPDDLRPLFRHVWFAMNQQHAEGFERIWVIVSGSRRIESAAKLFGIPCKTWPEMDQIFRGDVLSRQRPLWVPGAHLSTVVRLNHAPRFWLGPAAAPAPVTVPAPARAPAITQPVPVPVSAPTPAPQATQPSGATATQSTTISTDARPVPAETSRVAALPVETEDSDDEIVFRGRHASESLVRNPTTEGASSRSQHVEVRSPSVLLRAGSELPQNGLLPTEPRKDRERRVQQTQTPPVINPNAYGLRDLNGHGTPKDKVNNGKPAIAGASHSKKLSGPDPPPNAPTGPRKSLDGNDNRPSANGMSEPSSPTANGRANGSNGLRGHSGRGGIIRGSGNRGRGSFNQPTSPRQVHSSNGNNSIRGAANTSRPRSSAGNSSAPPTSPRPGSSGTPMQRNDSRDQRAPRHGGTYRPPQAREQAREQTREPTREPRDIQADVTVTEELDINTPIDPNVFSRALRGRGGRGRGRGGSQRGILFNPSAS